MPTEQFNAVSHWYELSLDDSSVVSAPNVHCMQPVNGPNGFVTFIRAGNVAESVARKISTGAEYVISAQNGGMGGGYNQWANDGRYIVGAKRVHQGKQFQYRDLVAYIFDSRAGSEGWLNFASLGRPTLDIFRGTGAGQKPLALWVKNGNQVDNFNGTDPKGIVRRFNFKTPTLIDFVLEQRINPVNHNEDDQSPTSAFLRCQRSFVLVSGEMSAFNVVDTWPVDSGNPQPPPWLYKVT